MRGAVTFLICAITLVLGEVQICSKCARDSTIERLLPHEKCNRFYQCVGGQLVAQRCAADLRFNIETQLCDWPDRVDCGTRSDIESEEVRDDDSDKPTINDDPSLAPIICAAEGSDGVLVAHEECNKFYICASGRRIAMECPKDLLYNPVREQCDWAENVKCPVKKPDGDSGASNDDDDDDSFKGNYDPSLAREICAAEGSDGVLVAHEYCNQFYLCSSGIRVTLRCPPNLLYNPRKEQCDWPASVNCDKRIVPDAISGNNVDAPNNDGGNSDPSEAPAICEVEESEGVLVAHEECNKFYKCSNNIPVAIECQLNLLYNPSKEQCDWPQNVDCSGRAN